MFARFLADFRRVPPGAGQAAADRQSGRLGRKSAHLPVVHQEALRQHRPRHSVRNEATSLQETRAKTLEQRSVFGDIVCSFNHQ